MITCKRSGELLRKNGVLDKNVDEKLKNYYVEQQKIVNCIM